MHVTVLIREDWKLSDGVASLKTTIDNSMLVIHVMWLST